MPEEGVAEYEVAGRQVAEQEVAVHVFVPLDGTRAEEGVSSLRAMWGRFRDMQGADRELYAALPVRVPDTLPAPPPHGSLAVAGVQSADRLDQAILRRHRDTLNLSVLLGAGPDREWSGLRKRLESIVGPLGACHLGAVTLELGKTSAQAPGDADLLEPERGDMADQQRLLRLLGRAGGDRRLGAWAWSDGGHPEMPHFVRYLMHMTAIRHQQRTYRWLAEARAAGTTGPLAVVRRPDGHRNRELPSTAEVHFIRDSVDGTWENAQRALEASGLDGGTVAEDDRRFASSFLWWLNDVLALLKRSGVGDPLPGPRWEPGRPVRVLVVADEWFPAHGGLSAFNSKLCVALARMKADVRVMVWSATPEERADAAKDEVRLIDVAQPGLSRDAALSVPPEFADGFVPDLVLGHGRVTGPPAKMLVERYFKNAGRLHFLHVEPDQAEAHKPHAEGDLAARAEDRTDLELRLCRGALHPMPVGPRLERALWPHLRTPEYKDLAAPVRIDPGFDGGTPATPPRPGEIPQILLLGRLEDADLKGLDIAARAVGKAGPKTAGPGAWHLLVRGVPDDESAALAAQVEKWVGNSAVDVIPRRYSADPRRIKNDLARASLVLMPSRAEAFGLAAAEAIAAGVPVLVSGRSGLGMLLRAQQSPVATRAVVDVEATRGSRKADIQTWTQAIHAVVRNPEAAFRDAAELREEMAARYTWATAATTVLDCLRRHGTA
ncbi:CATRA conflict system CASPASE/TPR repeat-associated protein [Streptomyces sp. DH10]|uniref:CATRA conflict system CASPASE/TPR repeat-associated protein n=1 Tax=Streptomyces sp. DH10 TaxID=3040121 RepID=UPI002441479C|nr:CATRA conflict system CASPASE/TPR repeat-associated protein [Streptomyces sp. DH10]MDG9708545.1 BN6_48550 family protein [Streptomyces sp. DH10]